MAEFVEKRCEDMIQELEQMERIKLFTNKEIRCILKKRREHEYRLERHTKSKEDFLEYIRYENSLLKLVKLRRNKLRITQKKSAIDYTIANRVRRLYRKALYRYQDDVKFWLDYIKFCKSIRCQNTVSGILGRMLQVHQDKPKCWHIAAQWEIEEAKNVQSARRFLLRGLHVHPNSALLYLDLYKLELKEVSKIKTAGKKEELSDVKKENEDISNKFKRAQVVYEQAVECVKEIQFVIDVLNVTEAYENTETLQKRIICDLENNYQNEPLMWDTMARRKLQGLPNFSNSGNAMEIEETEQNSPRDRITSCNEVYLTAVKKLPCEEMWSFYIDCMLEINQEGGSLPNFKRKLLSTALSQGHEAKMLKEEYYLYWIGMLNSDKKDNITQKKLDQVLCWATEALPNSEKLWYSRLKYLLITGAQNSVTEIFEQATKLLGENSLSLWRMKLQHLQATNSEKIQEFFQAALLGAQNVAKVMKIAYLEWAVQTKDIQEVRDIYKSIYLQPPFCEELHKKMVKTEIMQPEISVKNVRECFEIAILQYGRTNVNVWMDFIKFEMHHGDPFQVPMIHSRAVKTLNAELSDKFIHAYSLSLANPIAKNVPQNSL